jgi:hypothetical protein
MSKVFCLKVCFSCRAEAVERSSDWVSQIRKGLGGPIKGGSDVDIDAAERR